MWKVDVKLIIGLIIVFLKKKNYVFCSVIYYQVECVNIFVIFILFYLRDKPPHLADINLNFIKNNPELLLEYGDITIKIV